jgi:hypothetical protein
MPKTIKPTMKGILGNISGLLVMTSDLIEVGYFHTLSKDAIVVNPKDFKEMKRCSGDKFAELIGRLKPIGLKNISIKNQL